MKKKKGFTLIELLAVIVVLAIIALIATPIVMNTIKNAKKGAAERSGESYVKQLETTMMEYRMESGNTLPDGEYKITRDGNLCKDKSTTCSDEDKITIEMSGTKPSKGTITIENGQVSTTGTSMKFGDYTVSYDSTKKTYVAKVVEILCTAKTTATYGNKAEGNYNYGDEYSCELGDGEEKTFYVLETSGDNVSLIMDRNINHEGKGTTSGNTMAWISKEDYMAAGGDDLSNDDGQCQHGGICSTTEFGPITANDYLENSTNGWTKLRDDQISLPSAEQVATAAGKMFDGSHDVEWLPTWLTRHNGYWTSTYTTLGGAWGLYDATLSINAITVYEFYGVRPVITISKAQLG